MSQSISVWNNSLDQAEKALQKFKNDQSLVKLCAALGDDIVQTFKRDAKILICGNGGSHCDALHFAEEWTGRYRKDRKALPVLALGEASHTTCVSNDFGFEKVFSRQIEAFAKKEDLLITLTTSGNSKNILEALDAAKKIGTATWALLGKDGGKAKAAASHALIVPGETTDRIQELHMLILHIAIEHAERILFPENY